MSAILSHERIPIIFAQSVQIQPCCILSTFTSLLHTQLSKAYEVKSNAHTIHSQIVQFVQDSISSIISPSAILYTSLISTYKEKKKVA
jgi:preprotein translocase subunit SecY